MSGTAGIGAQPAPTAADPYGLSPSQMAWIKALQGMGGAVGSAMAPNSANYMRPNAPASFTPGTPNNLLATILQMRQAAALGLGSPYQPGVAAPRVSLLHG